VLESRAFYCGGGDNADKNVPVDGVVPRRILATEKQQSGSDLD
jgi:hypothetical protein